MARMECLRWLAMNKYETANGFRLSDEQAARYGNRITQLSEKKGFITPAIVLEDAKKESSPLHDYFEWDDSEAAKAWRLSQANYLIRAIVVKVIDEERPQIRQFFSITPTKEMKTDAPRVYVTLNTVLSDKVKREEVIAYAKRELKGWAERYRQYAEMNEIVTSIDSFLNT